MHEDIMKSQNILVKSQRLQILLWFPSNLHLETTSNNAFMRGLRFKLYLWLWYCEINILLSEDVNGWLAMTYYEHIDDSLVIKNLKFSEVY